MFPFFRSSPPPRSNAGFKPHAYKYPPQPRELSGLSLRLDSRSSSCPSRISQQAALSSASQLVKPPSILLTEDSASGSLCEMEQTGSSVLQHTESFFCSTLPKSISDISTRGHSMLGLSMRSDELEKGECVHGFLVNASGDENPVPWEEPLIEGIDLASLDNILFKVEEEYFKFNVRLSVESGCETYLLTRGLAVKKILKLVPRDAPHLPFADPWSIRNKKYYYGEVASLNRGYVLLDYNIIPRTQRYSRSDMQVSIESNDDDELLNLSLIEMLRANLAKIKFTLPQSETRMMTFVPVRTLGFGSYGIAQEVIDESNANTYVLKIINTCRQDIGYHKAENEISCYETCRKGDAVMPFIAGGSIGSDGLNWYLLMQKGAPLTDENGELIYELNGESLTIHQVLILVARIFIDLTHIHSKGIAHGDMKGANILVFDNLHPRLIDFGSACRIGISAAHAFEGSMAYIPPEHALDDHVYSDPRLDDIYAACVSLYHTFFGEHPLSRKSIVIRPIQDRISAMSRSNFLRELSSVEFNKRTTLDANASVQDQLRDMFACGMVPAESRPTAIQLLRHPVFSGLEEVKTYLEVESAPLSCNKL